jgi:hypothetical protein
LSSEVSECNPLATGNGCPRIWHLTVRGCRGVTSTALAAVALGCPSLTHLDLAHSDVDDAALNAFLEAGGVSRLQELDITGCEKLTNASIAVALSRGVNLTTLIATGCAAVTGAALGELVAGKVLHSSTFRLNLSAF